MTVTVGVGLKVHSASEHGHASGSYGMLHAFENMLQISYNALHYDYDDDDDDYYYYHC